jgi:aerobic-type carbon monoxide dehydrogenase small subunit (CoxS/CutS family)
MAVEDLIEDSVFLQVRINGAAQELDISPSTSLLDLLRDQMLLTGTHMGCMTGHCGACTVLVDGQAVKSCITPAASLQRKAVTTLEGLKNADGTLHPVQQAFWDAAAFQCAYCAPGMVLTTVELLQENPDPSEADVRTALAGNLCRCTGYQSIVRAALAAAEKMREQPK